MREGERVCVCMNAGMCVCVSVCVHVCACVCTHMLVHGAGAKTGTMQHDAEVSLYTQMTWQSDDSQDALADWLSLSNPTEEQLPFISKQNSYQCMQHAECHLSNGC